MSLHYLGIAHFPVLHRQFSSAASQGLEILESTPDQDVTQDNRDILIERLNDLVSRVSKNASLEASIVTAIHSDVDHIELLIRGGEKPPDLNHPALGTSDLNNPDNHEGDTSWRPPLTPSQSMRMPPHSVDLPHAPHFQRQTTPPPRVVEIASAAEDLALKLAAAVSELQIRKEESDHIHDLLITRAERAAQRIIVLEDRIADMQCDLDANQSELKFLRIQLQAIEVQSSMYVPRDGDDELTQSIMNWKIDWEDIDRRSRARRKKCHVSITSLDGSHTATDNS